MIRIPYSHSSTPAFFEAKYQKESDPWNFSNDPYELGRYNEIIASISSRRYLHAFEPGCSIGVLTERLADCCDKVTAFDFSVSAAFQAKQRCAHLAHVAVRCASIADAAAMDFDLLILSEVGYYFSQENWKEISWALIDRLSPGAVVVAAHWLGYSEDHCISGDQVNEVLLTHPSLLLELSMRNESMRLDRLVRL